jgi:succinate dehydrogenase / fumarate reductase cytochrome b subunit
VKDNRPVNLDINTMHLPITAYASILHRVSGVAIFFGVAVLLFLLDHSLESSEKFAQTQDLLASNMIVKAIVWLVLCGFIYHSCAGIKHLVMDLGIGETLEGGKRGAAIVLTVSVVLMLLAGVWVW